MATRNRGLGSNNMSQSDKDKIHRMGGEASRSIRTKSTSNNDPTRNSRGGGALSQEDKSKGGHASSSF